MKKLIYTSILFCSLSFSNASPVLSELPVGDYRLSNVEHRLSKHTVQIDLRSPEHKRRYKVLKDEGYNCARLGANLFRCTHFLKNIKNYDPLINLEKFKSLEPKFFPEYSYEVINDGELVSKFKVIQKVKTPIGEADSYFVYYHSDGQFMADVELANKLYRYSVVSSEQIVMIYKEVESPNKFEFYEHFIDLTFAQ